jgi:hypothetical protein
MAGNEPTPLVKTERMLARACILLGWAAIWAPTAGAGPFSLISDSETLTAVSAKRFNGYTRSRLPDGSYAPETFAFGKGGPVSSQLISVADPTIDDVSFSAIAHKIADPLARQNYVTGRGPDETRLLIMVFWGRTTGSAGVGTANHAAYGPTVDAIDYWNSQLLGFDLVGGYEMSFTTSLAGFQTMLKPALVRQSRKDYYDSLAVDRYFVILRAYDFQALWRQKRLTALWETRFSLSERRHDFGEELPAMARVASIYFGKDSHGIVRIPPVPMGNVDIGELETLGEAPAR